MKKNVASQIVGAQLNSKTDGSAVTSGTTMVYVTGDGGAQVAAGGSPSCYHMGNGWWQYEPTQGETNFDHVVFTFVNSSAVVASIQVYPSYPQTGDNYARLGAPVGASISADIAGVQSDTNDIQTRIPAALVSGRIDASVGAMATDTLTAAALAGDAVTEIQSGLSTLDAAGVRAAVGLSVANLDTQLATIDDFLDTEVAAIKAKTDNLPASPAATSDVTGAWTTAMAEAYAADGATMTPAQALYMIWSLLSERSIASTTLTAKKLDGSTTAMTFTLDSATTPTSQTRAT